MKTPDKIEILIMEKQGKMLMDVKEKKLYFNVFEVEMSVSKKFPQKFPQTLPGYII